MNGFGLTESQRKKLIKILEDAIEELRIKGNVATAVEYQTILNKIREAGPQRQPC